MDLQQRVEANIGTCPSTLRFVPAPCTSCPTSMGATASLHQGHLFHASHTWLGHGWHAVAFSSVCRLRHSHRLAAILAPGAICQVLRRHAVLGFTGAGQYPLQIQHFIFALYYSILPCCAVLCTVSKYLGNCTQKVYAPLLGSSLDRPQDPGPCPVYALKVSTSILPSPPLKPHPHPASAFAPS